MTSGRQHLKDNRETTLRDHIWEQVEDNYTASGETFGSKWKKVVDLDHLWKTTGSCGGQRFQGSRDPAGTLHMHREGGRSRDTTFLLLEIETEYIVFCCWE